jgi:hypothetical protein
MRTDLLAQICPFALEWVGPLLLCPGEVRRVPPEVPGVYLLHAFAPRFGGYTVFYVGRALDLRRRLLEHLGDRTAKPSVRAARELYQTYWSAAPVIDNTFLPGIESGLIRALRPICNAQLPTAAPLVVNLPPLSFETCVV